MTEPGRLAPADPQPTGADVLRWYNARSIHVGESAEKMADALAAAWAEVEEVRGQLNAARRLVTSAVSRGYARSALPTS